MDQTPRLVEAEREPASFPIVTLFGTPEERGRQHGRLFRDQIAAAVAALRQSAGEARWEEAGRRIELDLPMVVERAPQVFREIAGIAEGSGVGVPEILAHIGFEYFDAPASGCSALAVRSADGAIVAQNWDAPAGESAKLALFIHNDADGFLAAIVAPIGGLAWVGMNRDGLAYVNNDLLLRGRRPGIPSQIVRRLFLESATVEAALGIATATPHMAGRAYLFGDASGRTAAVEVSACDGLVVFREEAPILHTNHALGAALAAIEDRTALGATYPSSERRLQRMRAFEPPPRTVIGVQQLLRDETGMPHSICKHLAPDEKTQTTFSIVMETAARRMHLAMGRPSAAPYLQLQFCGRAEWSS